MAAKTYPTEKIRNVALVGHGGAGKTSLAEALLFVAGAIPAWAGSRTAPPSPTSTPRRPGARISVSLALAPFEYEGHKVNVIDTPGLRRLRRATSPPRCGPPTSRSSWCRRSRASRCRPRSCGAWPSELGLPRAVFVNKLDRERASFAAHARRAQGASSAPASRRSQLPIGEEADFHGVVELLDDARGPTTSTARARPRARSPPRWRRGALGPRRARRGHRRRRRRPHGALPRRRDDRTSTSSRARWRRAWRGARCSPCCAAARRSSIGVDRLAHFIAEEGPAPAPARRATARRSRSCSRRSSTRTSGA